MSVMTERGGEVRKVLVHDDDDDGDDDDEEEEEEEEEDKRDKHEILSSHDMLCLSSCSRCPHCSL